MISENNITVYTSLTGMAGGLREDQYSSRCAFVAFADGLPPSSVWTYKKPYQQFVSPRRNARAVKILSHAFVDTEYSIWMDSNVALKVSPVELVEDWLRHHDLATFAHHKRGCSFAEAQVCAERRLDNPALIEEQVKLYEKMGLRPNAGLAETTVVVRRHSPAVVAFNNAWWSYLCRYSVRDQLSFVCAAHQANLSYRLVSPSKLEHPAFEVKTRSAGIEPY